MFSYSKVGVLHWVYISSFGNKNNINIIKGKYLQVNINSFFRYRIQERNKLKRFCVYFGCIYVQQNRHAVYILGKYFIDCLSYNKELQIFHWLFILQWRITNTFLWMKNKKSIWHLFFLHCKWCLQNVKRVFIYQADLNRKLLRKMPTVMKKVPTRYEKIFTVMKKVPTR